MLKMIKRLLGWETEPVKAEDTRTHVPEEYAEVRIRLARELRECDERRLAYDRRTMHRPDIRVMHSAMLRGYVIDPGGTCLCRRCGRTVSALEDECRNCNNKLNWAV